jgi:pimeloyl-ACP methyl ester carboxylesterase
MVQASDHEDMMPLRKRHRRAGRVARLLLALVMPGLALASCSGSPAPAPAPSAPRGTALTVKACTVDDLRARCGTLIVPEDRLTGRGRTIPVRFVVIPAAGPDRAPDPVVYFAGGPGNSAVDMIPGELADIRNLNLHRDLVFVEQRGTGSSNPLTCPPFPASAADKTALRAAVESCVAGMSHDLPYYTTAMYADDVNQVLADLHYAKVNLMGNSYGTIAEQVFLLRHPSRVRTMTLQSGFPLDSRVSERAPGNSQLALDYVIARCAADLACHRAFPHLAADWAALWASAGTSAQGLDQDTLASWMYQALFLSDEAVIPVMIHTLAAAAAPDRATGLRSVISVLQAAGVAIGPGSYPTEMMAYAIDCAEPWATQSPAALSGQAGSFAGQLDLERAQWYQLVCPLIPKSAAAVGDEQLTVSRVPVLSFNGAGDPVAPARNLAGVQRFWPDFREVVLPGLGHDMPSAAWGHCAAPLTQTFIEQASVAHLNADCLASTPATPFVLSLKALG